MGELVLEVAEIKIGYRLLLNRALESEKAFFFLSIKTINN